jgi:hypothetical protein
MSGSIRCTRLLGAAAMAALALAAGCATTPEAKAARERARLQTLETQLTARGDADSLAAGALFARWAGSVDNIKSDHPAAPNAGFELATRAVAAAPQRADLVLEQLQFCQQVPSCDSPALEARFLELDPDNGFTWMYALLRAENANDPEAVRRARAGMARAQRIGSYWNETVTRLSAAVTGQAGFSAVEALINVIGVEAALSTPLLPVSKACSAQEIQQPEVLAQCRQIAAAFRRGDTELFAMYGTSLGTRLWPAGSPERAQFAAERRVQHYRMELWISHSRKLNSLAADRLLGTLYAQYPTEQEVFRALYVRLGLQPDPPADWIDRTPGG